MSNYEHLLFPTQLEKPTVAFDNRCVISPSQQLIANQPTIISPRISNESLKKTLARRAAYRFNVQPVQRAAGGHVGGGTPPRKALGDNGPISEKDRAHCQAAACPCGV